MVTSANSTKCISIPKFIVQFSKLGWISKLNIILITIYYCLLKFCELFFFIKKIFIIFTWWPSSLSWNSSFTKTKHIIVIRKSCWTVIPIQCRKTITRAVSWKPAVCNALFDSEGRLWYEWLLIANPISHLSRVLKIL